MKQMRNMLFVALVGLFVSMGLANAQLLCELGILTPDTLAGTNPATGEPWQVGDAYHLTYITTGTTNALSTDIADYNTFVSNDADSEGMGAVAWYVMGSTATTNAIDNVIITGPLINVFDNGTTATNADDFWNLNFEDRTNPTTVDGGNRNLHTGTRGGGVARGGNVLGATSVAIAWSAWVDWDAAWRGQSTSELSPLLAISTELTIQAPKASVIILY